MTLTQLLIGTALAATALSAVGTSAQVAQVAQVATAAELADVAERAESIDLDAISDRAMLSTRPPASWQTDDPADSLYRRAREQLNRGDYETAAKSFARIPAEFPRSVYAGDALYWEGYAHYSIGGSAHLRSALRALDAQRSRYARASTRGDADALAVRVRGALAQLGDGAAAQSVTAAASADARPCANGRRDDDDDDERIAAMNALLQMNAENAMPILRTVLARRDACSVSLRKKAVFLVSQKRTAETEDILLDVVRSDPVADIRKTGVFWLGQVRSERAALALEQLLKGSPSDELREAAVQALMQQNSSRGNAAVRAIAEDDRAPEHLREQAVFWLGQKQSSENATFLRELFDKLGTKSGGASDGVRQKILFSLSQMRGQGNDKWLMQIAADPKHSVETRKQAIFSAGQTRVETAELIALYSKLTDRELKGQLIWVLSEKRDPAAVDRLLEIAKRDPDPAMRKKAIFWLGQSRDPRVKQFLVDIING
ncbi:MAG: HEAT repeat domain-containing protein [Gemmatimonadaceae bacterium]